MNKEDQELIKETVKIYSSLYSVVVALALTSGIKSLVSNSQEIRSPFHIPHNDLLLFASFLTILIPFYHGAYMFIIKTYHENYDENKRGVILLDFIVLLFEGIILYAMAVSLFNIRSYIGWLMLLLSIDIIWVILVYYKSKGDKSDAPIEWGILNFFSLVYLFWLINESGMANNSLHIFLLVGMLVRTALDYSACYTYYFPKKSSSARERARVRLR